MSKKLDALVAERVMGLRVVGEAWCFQSGDDGTWQPINGARDSSCELMPVFQQTDYAGEECHDDIRIGGVPCCYVSVVPWYSTDISAAWEVVEKMKSRDPVIRRDGKLWLVIMDASDRQDDMDTKWHDHRTYTVSRRRVNEHDDSVCVAICLAALRAVGVPESEIREALQ